MEVKDYIKIYPNFLSPQIVSGLIQFLNKREFEPALCGDGDGNYVENFKIRKTWVFPLLKNRKDMTCTLWYNFLKSNFKTAIQNYKYDTQSNFLNINKISNIEALKYSDEGFFKLHTDAATEYNRALSLILLLNNDYEGGELGFSNPNGDGYFAVPKEVGTLIIWPSNFLYPHGVQPLKKGTRYSVVCWAN